MSRKNVIRALRVCNPLPSSYHQNYCHHYNTNNHDNLLFRKSRYERGIIRCTFGRDINRDVKHMERKEYEERLMEELEMELMDGGGTITPNKKSVIQHCSSQLFIIPKPNYK